MKVNAIEILKYEIRAMSLWQHVYINLGLCDI